MKIILREYNPSDLDQIVALYTLSFGGNSGNKFINHLKSGNVQVLDWKFGRSSLTRVIAEIDGKIIGHYGALPRKMAYSGIEIKSAEFADAMVHPDFGRRGIATDLNKFHEALLAEHGIQFIYHFPNKLRDGGLRKHQPDYSALPLPVLVSDKEESQTTPWANVYPVSRFGQEADELFERVKETFGFTTVRDNGYLNWRFCDNPINTYSIFVQKTKQASSDICGYVILKVYGGYSNKIGHIIDIMADSPATLENLLNFSKDHFSKLGIKQMTSYVMPGSPYFHDFMNNGFAPRATGRGIFVKFLDEMLQGFCQADAAKRMNLTMMDHDVY